MGGEPHRLTWKEVELRKAFKKRRVRLWTSVVNQENFTNRREDTFPPTRKMAAPLLDSLSEYLGSPEPAVRLIFSILIGEFLYESFVGRSGGSADMTFIHVIALDRSVSNCNSLLTLCSPVAK